uniref:Uncharacterized protein n=1 Tax=viral metagenome TaxID=1070528 RepID=A0A6C0KC31_9ZZZZ
MPFNKSYQFEIPSHIWAVFQIPSDNRSIWWHLTGDEHDLRGLQRPVQIVDVPFNCPHDAAEVVKAMLDQKKKKKSIKIIFRHPHIYDRMKLLDTCLRLGDGEGYEMQTQNIVEGQSKWFCIDFN